LTPYLLSLTYNDNVTGESDEVSLVFDDTDQNWQNRWYPDKGDKLTVSIGYNNDLVECGTFEVDEFELSKNPDQVTVKALGAGIKKGLRTKKSKAHEKKILSQIVKSIAINHGLTIVGNIKNIEIGRVTQNNESDLSFLNRLAKDFGYYFTIKEDKLIFYDKLNIQNFNPICGVTYNTLTSCSIRDKTIGTYKQASVSYTNPDTGENVEAIAEYNDAEQEQPSNWQYNNKWMDFQHGSLTQLQGTPLKYKGNDSGSEDSLSIIKKVENKQQAEEMAKSQLYSANEKAVEGSISLPGVQYFMAGVNFLLLDAFKFSGIYHIVKCSHTITKDGAYITSADIRRIKKLA